jgi:hypothetical protein
MMPLAMRASRNSESSSRLRAGMVGLEKGGEDEVKVGRIRARRSVAKGEGDR